MKNTTVKIESSAYGGKGIARVDGKAVFVKGALPKESAVIRITAEKKNFDEAEIIEILEPSPYRIKPSCPYAYTERCSSISQYCPGCRYMHVSYDAEIEMKQEQLGSLLKRIGKVENANLLPPVKSPSHEGYRNKLTLHSYAEDGTTLLGYFSEDNRSIIDINACMLGMEQLNVLLKKLRSDNSFKSSLMTHMPVTLRHTEIDGAVFWKGNQTSGKPLTETTPIGNMTVPRNGFFQVNPQTSSRLVIRARELISELKPNRVVDVYCGSGMFAIAAASCGITDVTGIEIESDAIITAKENAQRLTPIKINFMSGDANGLLYRLIGKNKRPADTMVIVDPPRRGLENKVISALCEHLPALILYISCAADTLARDISILKKSGYTLQSTQLFDMFPRTQYFESISVLKAEKPI